MDVSLTLIVIMAILFACGVYAMLERSLTRVLIGFLLLGNATNLLLLIVMGVPGEAPFFGAEGTVSDPLPQALTLTAIVITFAVSAFLLALIYRSWQLGQADTVEDDETDIALRERSDAEEDLMDDETGDETDEATTDFVGVQTAPITVLHMKDHPAIHDDAPVDLSAAAWNSRMAQTQALRIGTLDAEGSGSGADGAADEGSPAGLDANPPQEPDAERGSAQASSPAGVAESGETDAPEEDRS